MQKIIINIISDLVRFNYPDVNEVRNDDSYQLEHNGPILKLKSENNKIILEFHHGAKLFDPKRQLIGEDENIRYLKIHNMIELNTRQLKTWIKESMIINKI